MTDPYDDGMRSMRDAPVPDQWDDIRARAERPPTAAATDLASLTNGSSRLRPVRRWPLALAAAASVAVLVGAIAAVALVTRTDPDVATDSPAATSSPTSADSATETTATTTSATTTTSTTNPTSPTGAFPGEVVDENYPVSACRGLPFAANTPPEGIEPTMQPADSADPRVPSLVHGSITGVFPSSTPDRAVFFVIGWPGLQDDAGIYLDGPFPGVQSWIAPYDQGWLAEIAAPASADTYCPFTLIGLGLDEAGMRQFLAGLALEG